MKHSFLILAVLLFFAACKGKGGASSDDRDTPNKGTIRISVDESFKPVMEEQIKVFHSSFPETKIETTTVTKLSFISPVFIH